MQPFSKITETVVLQNDPKKANLLMQGGTVRAVRPGISKNRNTKMQPKPWIGACTPLWPRFPV